MSPPKAWTALAEPYPQKASAMLPILHEIQSRRGCVTVEDELAVAEFLGVPQVQVHEVVTFYDMFTTEKQGRRVIRVCHSIVCHLAGGPAVVAALEQALGIRAWQTTPDGAVTLETFECLAACDRAPVCQVDGRVLGGLGQADADRMAKAARSGRVEETPGRWYSGKDRTGKGAPILGTVFGLKEGHTLGAYRAAGGYAALEKARSRTPADVIQEVSASHLRGRGGAGFPTGKKWTFLPQDGRTRYLCVNADESEPGTFKDRLILEKAPHALLEGIAIAAHALGVAQAFVYIRGEFGLPYERLASALEEAKTANLLRGVDVVLHRGAGAYICGEETALLESLEGKKGFPRLKPPFPAVVGLYGCPTIINNVETRPYRPWILRVGGAAFAALGSAQDGGMRLYSLSGHIARPGVYELPSGITLRDIIETHGGGVPGGRKLKAVIPGGSSSALLTAEEIEVAMDVPSLAAKGTMLGSSAIIALDDTTCMVEASRVISDFYAHESCGQCTPCREGTLWMSKILRRVQASGGTDKDLPLLNDLCDQMWMKTICPLSDGAVMPARSFFTKFKEEFLAHTRDRVCPAGRCFAGSPVGADLQVGPPS